MPPLTLPDPGRLPPVEMLERDEAVRLFVGAREGGQARFRVT